MKCTLIYCKCKDCREAVSLSGFAELIKNRVNPLMENRNWVTYPGKCPKCGDRMIENKKYIECSAMHCTYILKVK